jgi:hypothetical protein
MDEHRTPQSVILEAELMTLISGAFRETYEHRLRLAVEYDMDASDEYGTLVRNGLDPELAYQRVVVSRQNRNQGGSPGMLKPGPDDGNNEAP